uniref:NADH-ubiquinone oxidoreductase chain 6 n=1 Tax=Hemisodorcus rubrofemoratus TaxID=617871 RepID=A0AA51UP71_9SCAR|nr:NADH dehydrogenase subunit 6 [Hemisodorcus rubrofemoratus]WMW30218.1 NADH dehydrogenase subunit 6 [Hemisodorcus rubrofemoratus]
MMMIFIISMLPAVFLPLVNHPLSLGLLLLIQSTFIALMSGWMNITFWYSYILLLIMIGGMLVLFLYMTSVASNEKFKFSTPLLIIFLTLILISMPLNFIDQWFTNSKILIFENINFISSLLSLNKFLNFPAIMISVILIIYLLITLIVVISISKLKQGPLRNYN